jgi:ribosomal protein L7/L12
MFVDGSYFEQNFETPPGPVTALAEVHIVGECLVLDELLFYPAESSDRLQIGTRQILEIFRFLRTVAKEQGFAELTVVFHRVGTGSHGRHLCEEAGMKVADPRTIDPAITAEMVAALRTGASPNVAIARMRSLGLNKIECIKLLREFGGVPLGQAKDIVHLSPAWADRYESDEAFHDAAERTLETMMIEDKLTAA